LLLFHSLCRKKKKAGGWTQKIETRQEGDGDRKERNKAETKRGIEKKEILAQNFQKVGMLFILTGPRGEKDIFTDTLKVFHMKALCMRGNKNRF